MGEDNSNSSENKILIGTGRPDTFRLEGGIPIFTGDPYDLTNEQLDACRFVPRKHNFGGVLDQAVLGASIGYFNEMRRALNGYSTKDEPEWQKMRHPFVFKVPDDIPDIDTLNKIKKGFWGGIQTMSAHTMGGVGKWEYTFFDPEISNKTVTINNPTRTVLRGENIWDHEYLHARASQETGQTEGYICVGLVMYKRPNQPDGIKLHRAFHLAKSETFDTVCRLAPMYPSQPDWESAFAINIRKSIDILQAKPWYEILRPELMHNGRYLHLDQKTYSYYLGIVEEELFYQDTSYAINRSKFVGKPQI